MRYRLWLAGLIAIVWLWGGGNFSPGAAQTTLVVNQNSASIDFPNTVTFRVEIEAESEIQAVALEYRVAQRTCGEVIAKAFPEITPGKAVTAEWTWDMRQSGSLPPGATISWQWRVTDAAGTETLTEAQSTLWLDDLHNWDVISGENIRLHWYEGGQAFGEELHTAAVAALATLKDKTGLEPLAPVDLYIYATFEDLRDAVLYEPGWTGGQAFPEHNIVIIGISPDDLEWGKETEAHELAHVLVGNLTFSCLGFVPTWLNEGLAMYGENGPDPLSKEAFEQALADDTLASVRALSGNFSEAADKADISYSQSYSLVQFLIDSYGKENIIEMLAQLRDGATTDQALLALYGFDIDGLEDAWRAAIGARPRAIAADASPTPPPTTVPTFALAAAEFVSPTPTPTGQPKTQTPLPPTPTLTATPKPTREARVSPTQTSPILPTMITDETEVIPAILQNSRLAFTVGGICLIFLGILTAFYLAVFRRPRSRRKPQ